MSKKLKKAELDVLVLQSGRELEQAARILVPEERDPEGKPLMLGPRMYRLRDQLDDDTWNAYQRWAKDRNAYVHGTIDAVSNREKFHEDYELVLETLTDMAEVDEAEPNFPVSYVIFAILAVCAILLAC